MVPVHQRIVEAEAQAFRACCVDVFPHEIATWAALGRTIVREFGIEVTEALVMLGGHHHVLHSGATS